MTLQYFEALKRMGDGASTKFIFPLEFTSMVEKIMGRREEVVEPAGCPNMRGKYNEGLPHGEAFFPSCGDAGIAAHDGNLPATFPGFECTEQAGTMRALARMPGRSWTCWPC